MINSKRQDLTPFYAVMEKEEANGALTLKMMQRAAHALDCEFAYVLIPKAALKGSDDKDKPKIRLRAG